MPATEPMFDIPYLTDLDPAADIATVHEAQARRVAEVMQGRVVNPDIADLQDEIAARAALAARVSKVETPMFGEYGCTHSNVPSSTEQGIPTLTKINQQGGLNAVVAGNFLELPPGLWILEWNVSITPATVTGRNFLVAAGGPSWSASVGQRHPWATVGEDLGGTTFLLPLPTTTGVALSIFTAASATYTAKHRIRVARIGTIPA